MIVSQYSLRSIVGMAEAVSIIIYNVRYDELTAPEGHRGGKARQQGVEKPVSTKKRNRTPAALKSMDM